MSDAERATRTIAVCIATFRRPEMLDALLASLARLEVPRDHVLELRVVDNDPDRGAKPIVDAWAGSLPGRLRYEVEPVRGISSARNHALDMGPADLVATIDDDEVASPRWLVELVATLDRTGADAVFGPVHGIPFEGMPRWMIRGGFFDKRVGREGRALGWNETRTSNALVRGAWFFARGLRYAESYGRTGGEDTELFARMALAGARFRASARAVVEERVPAGRATFAWLWRSSWSKTLRHHRVLESHAGRGRALRLALSTAGRVAKGTALVLAGLPLVLVGRLEVVAWGLLAFARARAGLEYVLRPSRAAEDFAYGGRPRETTPV